MSIGDDWGIREGEDGAAFMKRKTAERQAMVQKSGPVVAGKLQTEEVTPEDRMALDVKLAGLPRPLRDREHYFAREATGRGWRFDFSWPGLKLAVEVDGGVHRISNRFDGDMEKFNVAAALGWTVYHVSPEQVRSGLAIDALRAIFKGEGDLLEILQRKT